MLNLTLTEIIILQAGALILGFTIYFVYTNKRSLRKAMEASNASHWPSGAQSRKVKNEPKKSGLAKPGLTRTRKAQVAWPEPLSDFNEDILSSEAPHSVFELKDSLLQQQQTLSYLLQKVEDLQGEAAEKDALAAENQELQQRVEELELELMRKDQELKQARKQESIAQQMASRIDDVYNEFEMLQRKISTLEAQANRAGAMGLQLEDMQQSYQQLQKDLVRKQYKLDELIAENQRLRSELNLVEDKLAEANLQRQQTMKRSQFLQDMNTEIQSFPDNQSKLEKELRRIGELESMLKQMGEEKASLRGWRKNKLD